jgi:RNA polymerase sigma-70 factor (ECF subfamily)
MIGLHAASQVNKVEISTEIAFEDLFKNNFKALHAYACSLLKDTDVAQEVVQTVFLKLWERRGQLDIHTSARAYLYRAVYHDSLNHLKHQQVKQRYMMENSRDMNNRYDHTDTHAKELRRQLQVAMDQLPEKCRTIFQMSRFEDLKYQEIADRLGISLKTVEGHMGKALRILRLRLAEFLPLVIFTLSNLVVR